MALTSLRPKGRNDALWMLRVSIQTLDIAGDTCGVPPARDAFVSAHLLLTTIRVRFPLFYEDDPPTYVV